MLLTWSGRKEIATIWHSPVLSLPCLSFKQARRLWKLRALAKHLCTLVASLILPDCIVRNRAGGGGTEPEWLILEKSTRGPVRSLRWEELGRFSKCEIKDCSGRHQCFRFPPSISQKISMSIFFPIIRGGWSQRQVKQRGRKIVIKNTCPNLHPNHVHFGPARTTMDLN